MNDLFLIASGAGLQDGLNPCIFMTGAVFIAHGFWLKRRSFRIGWLRVIFMLAYALSIVSFNFGPVQVFVLQKNFVFIAKILYFVLGLWAFVSGILFFKEWVLLRRGLPVEDRIGEKINFFSSGGMLVCVATIILAIVLSALATIWPIDQYIILLGNVAILKGQLHVLMSLLVSYVLISMWPLWFVWAFLAIKNLRPSMLKIVCASVFFTASSCMLLIFK